MFSNNQSQLEFGVVWQSELAQFERAILTEQSNKTKKSLTVARTITLLLVKFSYAVVVVHLSDVCENKVDMPGF